MTTTNEMLEEAEKLINQRDFREGIKLLKEVIERGETDICGRAVFELIRASIWDIESYINQLVD